MRKVLEPESLETRSMSVSSCTYLVMMVSKMRRKVETKGCEEPLLTFAKPNASFYEVGFKEFTLQGRPVFRVLRAEYLSYSYFSSPYISHTTIALRELGSQISNYPRPRPRPHR
jgi:hypothetical protein